MNPEEKAARLTALYEEWKDCDRCGLCTPLGRVRKNVVFGDGNPDAQLMIVGEAPGELEDATGLPFHPDAPSGHLLDVYLSSVGLLREEVFITNVGGCRPTEDTNPDKNRAPRAEEIAACRPRLEQIIEIVDPLVLLLLGEVPMKALTKERGGITAAAKNLQVVQVITQGQCYAVPRSAFATFHPSFLLRQNIDWGNPPIGSEAHLAYQAFEKALKLIQTYRTLYGEEPQNG